MYVKIKKYTVNSKNNETYFRPHNKYSNICVVLQYKYVSMNILVYINGLIIL